MAQKRIGTTRFLFPEDSFQLPRITAGNLRDIMEIEGYPCKFYVPELQWFHWYDVQGAASAFGMPTQLSTVLHLRTIESALALLEEHPESFVMVSNETAEVPQVLEPYRNNLIVVTETEEGNPLAVTQEVFLTMLRWENQLNFLAHSEGGLEEILNIGSSMFDGFIYIVGVDNNVVAYSANIGFPNEDYEQRIRDGWIPSTGKLVGALSRNGDYYSAVEVAQVQDDFGSMCIAAPVRYEGSLFGFVVLVTGETHTATPSLVDQYVHFSKYAIEAASKKLKAGVERDIPHFYFLTALLRNERFTRTTIEQNLAQLGVPSEAWYKVVVVDPRKTWLSVDVLMDAMRNLNDHKSFVILFEDKLVAILYDKKEDGVLSHMATLDELDRYVYKPYGVISGFSQLFDHISDVRLGYRQALYALASYDAIKIERSVTKEEGELAGASFEMALPYFTIKENAVDRAFHEFCLSHSPLESLLQSDLENGTNNFLLLWLFLLYERNVSLVGRRLYMHRNSVLYHIRQIEKRFSFQLDS